MKRSSSSRSLKCTVPLALAWSHAGMAYRVTPWPEARFEKRFGDEWIPTSPTEDALASAAQTCGAREWAPYLEFVPAGVRGTSFEGPESLNIPCATSLAATWDRSLVRAIGELLGHQELADREDDAVRRRAGL